MNRHLKLALEVLADVARGECGPDLGRRAAEAHKALAAPRRRTERERAAVKAKRQKQQGRREKVAAIRAEVMARAGGRCEAYAPTLGASENPRGNRCNGLAYAMDHWLGGSGRRRAEESVETCWALCRTCNALRTDNVPSATYWNLSFEIHASAHGYPFTPHYDARAASRAAPEREDAK